ncbi:unnamed protein product, partial [Allacma fusca]
MLRIRLVTTIVQNIFSQEPIKTNQGNKIDLFAQLLCCCCVLTHGWNKPARIATRKFQLNYGVTGFVGRALLEKLLRGCPEVAKVFVLVRSKRQKSGEERLREMFQAELFKNIRSHNPDLLEKVIPVNGDVTFKGLGLRPEDSEALREVSIIFHSAANVNFCAGFQNFLAINVAGTKHLLEFAKELKNLKALVYVSTTFSNSDRLEIKEKIYPSRINPHLALQLYSELPPQILDAISPKLLGDHKLEYSFSKHIAEGLIQESSPFLPICVVRPAVVGTAYEEPFPGWVDNYTGFMACLAAFSKGIARVYYTNKKLTGDIVPIDYAVNLTLAAAMSVGSRRQDLKSPLVYNLSTSDCPLIGLPRLIIDAARKTPPNQIVWYPSLQFVSNRTVFLILDFFFHYIPAVLADGAMSFLTSKPEFGFVKIHQKLRKLADITAKATEVEYSIRTENTRALYRQLTPGDQESFHFDIWGIDPAEYMRRSLYGMRRYAAREKDGDLPKARANLD